LLPKTPKPQNMIWEIYFNLIHDNSLVKVWVPDSPFYS